MTQSTEQERASLSSFIDRAGRDGFDTAHNFFDCGEVVFFNPATAGIWKYWQAARRAPAAPEAASMISSREVVSKPGSGVTVTRLNLSDVGRAALQSKANHIEDAAPQPPEACTCPSGDGSLRWPCPKHPPEAAPVQLPENVYTLRIRGRLHDYTPALPAFDLEDGEHKLYTEQQVRQLLAAQARKG